MVQGRIYEEKCDLSPDGRLFVYKAHQRKGVGTEFTDSWTAVSKPPWLKALVLWPEGTTYGGGGRFTGPRTLWGVAAEGTHPDFPFRGLQLADAPPEPRPKIDPVDGADWTGADHNGNILFSKGDLLYRKKRRNDLLLADFSSLEPNPQPAPAWAGRW